MRRKLGRGTSTVIKYVNHSFQIFFLFCFCFKVTNLIKIHFTNQLVLCHYGYQKNPFKNFGEAGVSQKKNKTKQNTATFRWCFHNKSCHAPLPCTHQSTEGQFIYKSSSQSPRMSLTKEATSVSLDSCRVKKGCCWERKERKNRKVYN